MNASDVTTIADLEAFLAYEQTETYEGFPIADLRRTFSACHPAEDWKGPIDVPVPAADLWKTCVAIQYFTATVPQVAPAGDTDYRVTSIGYRMGPAGDH